MVFMAFPMQSYKNLALSLSVVYSGFILVAITYLKWWPRVGWKGLDTKRFDVFLGLKY